MASTCPDSFCQSAASTTVAAEPVRSKQIQRNPTKNNVHMAPLQPYHVATDKVWSELTQSTERRRSTVQARTAADAKRLCSTATQQATAIRFPANYFWHSRLPRVPSCWKTVLCVGGFAFALLEFDAGRLRHFINLELLHIALRRCGCSDRCYARARSVRGHGQQCGLARLGAVTALGLAGCTSNADF